MHFSNRVMISIVALVCCSAPYRQEPRDYESTNRGLLELNRDIIIDNKIPLKLESIIIDAAIRWDNALNGHCPVHFIFSRADVDDELPIQYVATVRLEDFVGEIGENAGWTEWGYGIEAGARVVLRSSADEQTVKHELGHAFKIEHEQVDSGVMQKSRFITIDDVNAYSEIWCK